MAAPRRPIPNRTDTDDLRWLDAAARLALRGRPLARPNPAVGCIIVKNGHVIGRGWTQAGGRPHAEAVALAEAGPAAKGSTVYVTLEPCAHASPRGAACADALVAAAPRRVLVGVEDPDPRTAGKGLARLRDAGIEADLVASPRSETSLAGYLTRARLGRPHVTLKLALSLDGCIARANGESRWITGPEARAHVHSRRALADAILVGGGTLRADSPALDVRLPGLEGFGPRRLVLTRGTAPKGWTALAAPREIAGLEEVLYLYLEGGAVAAAAFLAEDLVDRIEIYRAPIVIGRGRPALGDIGLDALADAHGRWRRAEARQLGSDDYAAYERRRQEG